MDIKRKSRVEKEQDHRKKFLAPNEKEDEDDEDHIPEGASMANFPTYKHPLEAKLPETDFTKMPENFFAIIYGVRRTGKSHWVSYQLSTIKERFDFAYLFSETALLHEGEKGIPTFNMIRDEAKFPEYNAEALRRIFDRQAAVKKHNNKCKNEADMKPNKTLIIFDDFVHAKEIRYDPLFTRLPVLGRHYDLSVICLTQGYSSVASGGLNKATRQNADFVGTFLPRNSDDLERMSSWYLTKGKMENMWLTKSVCETKHQLFGIDLSEPHLVEYLDFCSKSIVPKDIPEYELGKIQWHIYREEEKRAKAAAKAEDARKATQHIFCPDGEMEARATIGLCTGLPERRVKMTLFDACLGTSHMLH